MTRVYVRGKQIPMESVTWDDLCSFSAFVTNDDPDIKFPTDIRFRTRQAPLEIAKALNFDFGGFKAKKPWWRRIFKK